MVKRAALLAIAGTIMMTTNLLSQDQEDTRGRTYAFLAPGRVDDEPTLHIGFGGETPLYKGLNLGAELGLIRAGTDLEGTAGLLAVNGSYHFRNVTRSARLVPFITGGTSLAFPYGGALGVNFGGGLNYWIHDRMGWRAEFRNHMFYGAQIYEFRIGFTFRGKR